MVLGEVLSCNPFRICCSVQQVGSPVVLLDQTFDLFVSLFGVGCPVLFNFVFLVADPFQLIGHVLQLALPHGQLVHQGPVLLLKHPRLFGLAQKTTVAVAKGFSAVALVQDLQTLPILKSGFGRSIVQAFFFDHFPANAG